MDDEKKVATATIKIDKEQHGGKVRGTINGQKFELPVGTDVEVTGEQLSVLSDSNVAFDVVKPLDEAEDEGSSSASTVEDTAIRLETDQGGEESMQQDTPELSQRTDEELAKDSQEASKEQAGEQADDGEDGDEKQDEGDDSADLPGLSGKTTAQLEEIAKAEGVDLSSASTNDDRKKAIEDARNAK